MTLQQIKYVLGDLAEFHFVTYDTDDVRSFFSEEVLERHKLNQPITVADRATELNLLKHLNGYTFLSGVLGEDSSEDFVSIPLKNPDGEKIRSFELGYIKKSGAKMDEISLTYIDSVRRILNLSGFVC